MKNEETIFAEAAVIGGADARAAYLDQACGGDAGLRREVERLLAAHDRATGFMQSPAVVRLGTGSTRSSGMRNSDLEAVGATVGPYTLLERIGEGGMGVVYLADQLRPVRRRVALKIIKPGMDSRQVIARFEAERQALALMDHPSIARVLDAGTTDAGLPYFAMELVRGVPITEYCDANHLAPRERLGLFVQVSQAVQHAHTKGVIHRDLKPTNILVTLHDGVPVPKIIDFGIAKATGGAGLRLTDKTLFTNFAQMVGTPLYMSPEQAEFSGLDVDTRSDIYSLGVLLYELLTGTTPFDKKRLGEAALDEVRRIICEEEPPRPSTRLSTLLGETLSAVSANRKTEPGKLGRSMRGELDWIVMKALEKDRTRRYDTATGLAADVRRFLDDEPVSARPAGKAYLLRKWVRRHKAGAAAAATVTLALVLGLVGTSYGLRRARAERDKALSSGRAETRQRQAAEEQRALAQANEGRAQGQAARAKSISSFLQRVLGLRAPWVTHIPAQELAAAFDRLEKEGVLSEDPGTEAAIHVALGDFYRMDDRPNDAVAHYRAALSAQRRALGDDDLGVAQILNTLAGVLRNNGDQDPASEASASVLSLLQRRGVPLPSRDEHRAGGSRFLALTIHLEQRRDLIERQPEDGSLWNELAYTALSLGRLDQAADGFAAVARLNQREHYPLFFSAGLHLYLGDDAAYERDCRALMARFASVPDGGTLDFVAKASLLRGECPVKLAEVLQVLDRIEGVNKQKGDPENGWYHLVRGMAAYRGGRFESAVEWLTPRRLNGPAGLTANLFVAMSKYRLGQLDEARSGLQDVLVTAEKHVPQAGRDLIVALPENWLVFQIALREARELIQPADPPPPARSRAAAVTQPANLEN